MERNTMFRALSHSLRILRVGSAILLPVCGYAAETVTTPVLVQKGLNYRRLFDQFDAAYAPERAKIERDNTRGKLAWLESYAMLGYMQMYHATSDTVYLRKLTARFDEALEQRDDKLGRLDDYTSKALAGWGTSSYLTNGARWHVFIVHSGMITLGPAEFVNAVRTTPGLQAEFGTSATIYTLAIRQCNAGAEPYWRNGPEEAEGYYEDPALGLLPLNQSNAMGCTLLEMHDATGNTDYLDHARRLARFFRNRLREVNDHYEWAYWPKHRDTTTATEDISHAAINVDFARRCASRGIEFTASDITRFSRTWTKSVRRPEGTWAGTVGGTGSGARYLPQAAGRWLAMGEHLDAAASRELYADVERAFENRAVDLPSQALGIAYLARYRSWKAADIPQRLE